jgi:hypothetical protein
MTFKKYYLDGIFHRTAPYRNRPSIVPKNSAKATENAIFLSKRLAFLTLIFPKARSEPLHKI